MKKLDIWCEGIADQKFLADVIQTWFGLNCTLPKKSKTFDCRNNADELVLQIRATGTVNTFISETEWVKAEKDFQDNRDEGVKNVAILDADVDFRQQTDAVLATTKGMIEAENLFLWPNNQPRTQGQNKNLDLELLLEQIINPNNQTIFDCWDSYENCLKAAAKNYTTPAQKTKIYGYLEALVGESKSQKELIKERERDYTNPAHWNLEADQLTPLKEFLQKHLSI